MVSLTVSANRLSVEILAFLGQETAVKRLDQALEYLNNNRLRQR